MGLQADFYTLFAGLTHGVNSLVTALVALKLALSRLSTPRAIRFSGVGCSHANALRDGWVNSAGPTTEQVEPEMFGTAPLIQGHSGHKRHLVFGGPVTLGTGALATKVGVIHLNDATESVDGVRLGHGLADLVVHQPSTEVAHPELALERQGLQANLGIVSTVDGIGTMMYIPSGMWKSAVFSPIFFTK